MNGWPSKVRIVNRDQGDLGLLQGAGLGVFVLQTSSGRYKTHRCQTLLLASPVGQWLQVEKDRNNPMMGFVVVDGQLPKKSPSVLGPIL